MTALRARVDTLTKQSWFERLVLLLIVLNAVTLGLETAPQLVGQWMGTLLFIDRIFVLLFTAELLLKLFAQGGRFWRQGWNIFDFVIVAISWLPVIPGLSVLRALRVLRVLRVISVVPQFRKVAQAFIDSLTGLASVGAIILLFFYVGAVMSTKLFGAEFSEWFGTIGRSFYSLFQIMTLESWSMGIVRPVMEVYPYAWAFFVPFILLTTFAAVNLLIGVIVNSMQNLHDVTTDTLANKIDADADDRHELRTHIESLEASLDELKRRL
jgi:voltage-gated sodium channel